MAWMSAADMGSLAGSQADVAELDHAGPWRSRSRYHKRAHAVDQSRLARRSGGLASQVLEDIGSPVIGDVEPVLSWELSCVLRAQTSSGAVFFKVALDTPLFANEASVVAELAALFPGEVPTPLAVDRGRRFLVLADAGPVVGWRAPIEAREEVMRAAARLQIRSAPHMGRLLGGRLPRPQAGLAGRPEHRMAH